MDYLKYILLLSVVIFIFGYLWNFILLPITLVFAFIRLEFLGWIVPRILTTYFLLSMCTLSLLYSFGDDPSTWTIILSTAICFVFIAFYLSNSILNKEKEKEQVAYSFDFNAHSKFRLFDKYKHIEQALVLITSIGVILFRIFPALGQNIITQKIFSFILWIYDIPILGFIIAFVSLGFVLKISLALILLLFFRSRIS